VGEKLEGIGGWLLFYIVMTGLLLAIGIIGVFQSAYLIIFISNWNSLVDQIIVMFGALFYLFLYGLGIFSLIRLLQKRRKAIALTRGFLWLLLLFILIMGLLTLFNPDTQKLLGDFGTDPKIGLIGTVTFLVVIVELVSPGIAWLIVWLVYFTKSERVKNTLVR